MNKRTSSRLYPPSKGDGLYAPIRKVLQEYKERCENAEAILQNIVGKYKSDLTDTDRNDAVNHLKSVEKYDDEK